MLQWGRLEDLMRERERLQELQTEHTNKYSLASSAINARQYAEGVCRIVLLMEQIMYSEGYDSTSSHSRIKVHAMRLQNIQQLITEERVYRPLYSTADNRDIDDAITLVIEGILYNHQHSQYLF
jgi:hypothetical protein